MSATAAADVVSLFEANAATYDRVNTIVSVGMDRGWRDWAARSAVTRPGAHVLDAFGGTGLVGLRAGALGADVTIADISLAMLARAEERARRAGAPVRTVAADLTAERLPALPGAPFDSVTVVFGVRYLAEPAAVLRRLAEQTRQGGRVVVMDFVGHDGSVLSRTAWLYFSRVIPFVGGVLAGDRALYDELVATTRALGGRERLTRLVEDAGLRVRESRSMGFGLVLGLVAEKVPGAANGPGLEREPGGAV